jgi:hypothetical protein
MQTQGRQDKLSGKDKDAESKLRYFYVHKGITFPGVFATLLFLLFFSSCDMQPVKAEILLDNLWKGLIAEDVSGGYQGMYGVACCVRNRLNAGMNTGLVGLKRKDLDAFVKRQGVKYELMAKDIVRKIFIENAPDITRGAIHYEDIERYGLPKWAKGMVRTIKIGEHQYFKEI